MPKVLYIYQHNPEDVNTQSGRPYNILKRMREAGVEVKVVCLNPSLLRLMQGLSKALQTLSSSKGDSLRSKGVAAYVAVAAIFSNRGFDADYIFSPSTIPFLGLPRWVIKGAKRIACCDTLLPGYIEYYSYDKSRSLRDLSSERQAVSNCDYIFVPTQWAASQVNELGLSSTPEIRVAPFGANVETEISEAELNSVIEGRACAQTLRISTIVSDWLRKNGDLVVALLDELHSREIDCVLDVVGSKNGIPSEVLSRSDVRFLGRLDKRVPEQHLVFERVLKESAFFCMPSKGEAFGMSLCEAASFGVPLIGSINGGIAEIVRDGVNGTYMNDISDVHRVAEWIEGVWAEKGTYLSLCDRVYADYKDRLNWDSFYRNTFSTVFHRM